VWDDLLYAFEEGTRMIQSNTPGACWRRGLDRAGPLYTPIPGRICKRVPDGSPKNRKPHRGFRFFNGLWESPWCSECIPQGCRRNASF